MKFNKKYIIIFALALILIIKFDFFKNFFLVFTRDYNTRLQKIYPFCDKESVGFVYYIKSKYSINKKILIQNYEISPDPTWVFYNKLTSYPDDKELILLNYKDFSKILFEKNKDNKNYYYTNSLPSDVIRIKKIIFNSNNNLNNETIEIKIYHLLYGEKKLLYKTFLSLNKKNEAILNLDLNEINIRNGRLNLEILHDDLTKLEEMEIASIIFLNNTKYDKTNYNIIEKIENCFYLKKND